MAAIAEASLAMAQPSPAEQDAWHAAMDDMWCAAAVGYPGHLLLLLRRHRMPVDYLPPGGTTTLLLAAAGVHTLSASLDRDLAAVLRLLLARGAWVAQAQHGTGATALHTLAEQPPPFETAERVRALLAHIGAASSGAGGALEVVDSLGRRAEDVAAQPQLRERLQRLRVMIDLRARR